MPEKDIGAKCRDRAVQVERLEKPLDAAGKGAKVFGGAGGSLGTVRKTSPGQSVAGGKATVEAGKATGRSLDAAVPERQCLRKTLEQSAGTEPCRAKG